MFYAIDFDTRSVESKSESGEDIAAYIIDNELDLAVALISNEEELAAQFSLNEMLDLHTNLTNDAPKSTSEQDCAAKCWSQLEEHQDEFPTFTPSLGKKLLKSASKRCENKPEPSTPSKPERKTSKPRSRSGRLTDDTVLVVGEQPKAGTLPHKVWTVVEDNFGELSIGEIISECSELDETTCRKQITRSVRKGFLIKKEEEL